MFSQRNVLQNRNIQRENICQLLCSGNSKYAGNPAKCTSRGMAMKLSRSIYERLVNGFDYKNNPLDSNIGLCRLVDAEMRRTVALRPIMESLGHINSSNPHWWTIHKYYVRRLTL